MKGIGMNIYIDLKWNKNVSHLDGVKFKKPINVESVNICKKYCLE